MALQIIAATDFSMRSLRALRRAGLLARQCAAELVLVYVVDDDQPQRFIDIQRREAQTFLDEQIGAIAELRGVSCRAAVTTGEPFDGILRAAKDCSADLIVMGAHRKLLLRDIFVGTTIERVIRTGPYPVLMVNKEVERPYDGVLAAVDLSEPSAHAVKTARGLRLLDDVEVLIVHAFTPPAKGRLYVANAPQERIDQYVADEASGASAELSAFIESNDLHREHWRRRVEEGAAFDVISRVAMEAGTDLVVVGTHRRTGAAKLFLGSVTEEVLRSLDIDILAVPPAPP
jgi:nucleotide-binding universal stress UspA family protein